MSKLRYEQKISIYNKRKRGWSIMPKVTKKKENETDKEKMKRLEEKK